MKKLFHLILFFLPALSIQAQPSSFKQKKYPSVLWEISGNGLKKHSFLIGTMHVSSKLAFHLPDSFYYAVKNAQVVALETNPETWQDDMAKYEFVEESYLSGDEESIDLPDDYLHQGTLRYFAYENNIKRALTSRPSVINNLLYRSYGDESEDYEEDTYLDMYIFQCGKKSGKTLTGLEDYGRSMKLMEEAYKDAAKDKNKKERSYDVDEDFSYSKLQDAYRSGNLDWLDSINKANSTSAAFDEKFLYRRNEIQAGSIDSILKTGSAVFAGVGAAHLPGDRGVIELLREKGYKLRPVKMGERDSHDKDIIDKMRVPVIFHTQDAADDFYKVDVPGKLYDVNDFGNISQKQFADMSNGSYYMVTRLMTSAWMWNHSPDDVYRKVDSLLYENIPGKIISKNQLDRNGYKGFDITNRTRRGDLQRYNIFITPSEIIIFKMSGNGDYVKDGEEASRFFNSIRLKDYSGNAGWKKFTPAYGGFSVDMPGEPYTGNDGSWIFDAEDKQEGADYRVVRSDIHNFNFAGEDKFDLELMQESFRSSDFIDTLLSKKILTDQGYPCLQCRYKDKDGLFYETKFIIQGPHYYTLAAHGKKETAAMQNFFRSFEIKPLVYQSARIQKDTSLHFTVTTPVYPDTKKIKMNIPRYSYYSKDDEEEGDDPGKDAAKSGDAVRKYKVISNDTTGEKIYVIYYKMPLYFFTKDSVHFRRTSDDYNNDSTWTYRVNSVSWLPGKMRVKDLVTGDSASSRVIHTRSFYKSGNFFTLISETDTLTRPSAFIENFYDSFKPDDNVKGINPFEKKTDQFFADFMSTDSMLHKRAVKHLDDIDIDSSDFPLVRMALERLNWKEKKYLDTKCAVISKLGEIDSKESSDYLKGLYYASGDTIQLQYAVLGSLLQHENSYAYAAFREIISNEPPAMYEKSDYTINRYDAISLKYNLNKYLHLLNTNRYRSDENFISQLSDSLLLTKAILPDLLPLLNLEDYKNAIMSLLGEMVDSNLLKPADYASYFSKFLLEAKLELKKQAIAEKNKSIQKAEEDKNSNKNKSVSDDDEKGAGNEDLGLYAKLLLPFMETNASVPPVIRQMLGSADKKLKYNTLLLLLAHDRPVDDTLFHYFASMDEFRYDLYRDLKRMKKNNLFPQAYNNHLDLGRSALLNSKSYGKPDTLVYLDRLPASLNKDSGFVYFYKYKDKKDDLTWKLATVGLVPVQPDKFEFDDEAGKKLKAFSALSLFQFSKAYNSDFTDFSEIKIDETKPLPRQLDETLKKLLYAKHKSGKNFYSENRYSDYEDRLTD